MYAFELCAAISDDFRNSPEMAAHDLNTYIFRVGESPKQMLIVLNRLIHDFCTYINHCV